MIAKIMMNENQSTDCAGHRVQMHGIIYEKGTIVFIYGQRLYEDVERNYEKQGIKMMFCRAAA